jgi:DHA1 family bicyclomycin/chloramphenicol resistance-like MFS transporter
MRLDKAHLWQGPRWALSLLLAGLSMVGPFSIDTYLPAFEGMAQSLGATPVQMQQTLSGYLFGFALMNLFHGALSDSVGRRPVVLGGLACFTIASAGCALSGSIGTLVFWRVVQGMSAGAGSVVSRAVIRDLFEPHDAQRVMSNVTLFFGMAPAIAPLVGGLLFTHVHWRAIFWFLTGVGVLLWLANARLLPETLHAPQRQSFSVGHLLRGYRLLGSDPRFVMLALASGVPFNGMFLYVLSAPAFLGGHLRWRPDQFFWFFCMTILGIMGGAWLSGRLAGRLRPGRQIFYGFCLMLGVGAFNVLLNAVTVPRAPWALLPIPLFAFGWAMVVPAVTLMVLDLVPERRGMASSLQACLASTVNGVVAGVLAPVVMHSPQGLASASLGLMAVGAVAWWWIQPRLARPGL